MIVADAPEIYDVYVDRNYETYLANWLAESSSIFFSYRNQTSACGPVPEIR